MGRILCHSFEDEKCCSGKSYGRICFDNFLPDNCSTEAESGNCLLSSGDFPTGSRGGDLLYGILSDFGKKELFAAKGLETFEIALAIVFGIIFGFSIPEALFHKREKNKKQEES